MFLIPQVLVNFRINSSSKFYTNLVFIFRNVWI